MKRFILFCSVFMSYVLALAQVNIDNTNFPDDGFRKYVLEQIDKDKNQVLSQAESDAATYIRWNNVGDEYRTIRCTSLKGLEYFKQVRYLALPELDRQKNIQVDLSIFPHLEGFEYSGGYSTMNWGDKSRLKTLRGSFGTVNCSEFSSLDTLVTYEATAESEVGVRYLHVYTIKTPEHFKNLETLIIYGRGNGTKPENYVSDLTIFPKLRHFKWDNEYVAWISGHEWEKPVVEDRTLNIKGLKKLETLIYKDVEIIDITGSYAPSSTGSLTLETDDWPRFKHLEIIHSTLTNGVDLKACPNLEVLKIKDELKYDYNLDFQYTPRMRTVDINCNKTTEESQYKVNVLNTGSLPELTDFYLHAPGSFYLDLRQSSKLKNISTCGLYGLDLNESVDLDSFMICNTTNEIHEKVISKAKYPGFDVANIVDANNVTFVNNTDILVTGNEGYCYKTGAKQVPGKKIDPSKIWVNLKCPQRPVSLPAELPLENFYDADGDGVKECFYNYSYKNCKATWEKDHGFTKKDILPLPESFYTNNRNLHVAHFNNDGHPDFTSKNFDDKTYINMALSQPDGSYVMTRSTSSCYPLDANNDGLPDMWASDGKHGDYKKYIKYQNADGSFTESEIDTVSTEIMDSLYVQRIKDRDSKNNWSAALGSGLSMVPGNRTVSTELFFKKAFDANRDGLIDLVGDKTIYYQAADNKYLDCSVGAAFIAKDINGDLIPDYIFNDKKNKTVYTQIYQGNGNFVKQTIVSDLDISDIHCYDFDKDNDVDLLLTFNYNSQFQYAFLIFAENDGHGHFAIHENAFDKQLEFQQCLDIDNNGFMDIIAFEELKETHFYYIIPLDNCKNILAPEVPLIKSVIEIYSESPKIVQICDMDNDGRNELLFDYAPSLTYKELPMLDHVNQAPEQLKAPQCMANAQSGVLKIQWERGQDKETSPFDLTYALRIGSQPGKDDIYFSAANRDGSRRNFSPGNMDVSLETLINVSNWKKGTYYIAIQAVDPMGKGSKWSEETVYKHDLLTAKFTVSATELLPQDTLYLKTAPQIPGRKYVWNYAQGKVVGASADSSLIAVVFPNGGYKDLRLTVQDIESQSTVHFTEHIYVKPFDWEYADSNIDDVDMFFDIDNDGYIDGKIKNCFYMNDGKGNFKKMPTVFNSNLSMYDPTGLFDYDMDGDFDLFCESNKGNVIKNNGNKQFEGISEPRLSTYDFSKIYDINNDGFMDFLYIPYRDPDYFVDGSNLTYQDATNFTPIEDFNRDGLIDGYGYGNDHSKNIYINEGSFKFRQATQVDSDVKAWADFNNDGYPDYITHDYYSTSLCIHYGNKNLEYKNLLIVHDYRLFKMDDFICNLDVDNNGCIDIQTNEVTFLMEKDQTFLAVDTEYCLSELFVDTDNDGIPDSGPRKYLFHTTEKNSIPLPPQHVRASMTQDGVLIEWDEAVDAETPGKQMRYNVSVKKKGATGPQSFIVSPMNSLNGKAALSPHVYYPKATRKLIPANRFEPGQEYEVQIQSIDLWNAHSDFSEVYTFNFSKDYIEGENEARVNQHVNLKYMWENPIDQDRVEWNLDGAKIVNENSIAAEVYWEQPGIKTITGKVNGVTTVKTIKVFDFNLDFKLPESGLADTEIEFNLPEELFTEDFSQKYIETSDSQVQLILKDNSRTAKAVFPDKGNYWLQLTVNHPVYGKLSSEKAYINIVGKIGTPAIRLVTMDPTTGKNKIMWDNSIVSDFVTAIKVYKEGSRYNQFNLIAEVDPTETGFVDFGSNPAVQSDRYYITLATKYGVESAASRIHSSTHLMLSKGMNGAVNLLWNKYEGAIIDHYRIMRGTTPDNLELLAEVSGASSSYTDTDTKGQDYYYALAFDEVYSNVQTPEKQTFTVNFNDKEARSNVVHSADAIKIKTAYGMTATTLEKVKELTPNQPRLHFIAEFLPTNADIQIVDWEIVKGENLATIDKNGVLIAKGYENGEIVVQAKTVDGSNLEFKATVVKKDFAVTITRFIITSDEGYVLDEQHKSIQLKIVIEPADAPKDVIWTIEEGKDLATVDNNGKVTAIENNLSGRVVVRATSVFDPTIYNECVLSKEKFVTGIGNIFNDGLFINVSKRDLWINGLPENETCLARIFDYSGRLLKNEENHYGQRRSISLSDLNAGVYLLELTVGHERKTFRFVLK